MKLCKTCGVHKGLNEMRRFKLASGEWSHLSKCRDCWSAEKREYDAEPENKWRAFLRKNPESAWESYERFLELLTETHCECCGVPLTTGQHDSDARCIDHCHQTGRLRAALCRRCNKTEGQFKDAPDALLFLYELITGEKP